MELSVAGSKATVIWKKKTQKQKTNKKKNWITFTHKEERKEHINENTLYSY